MTGQWNRFSKLAMLIAISIVLLSVTVLQANAAVPEDIEPGNFVDSKYSILVDTFADRAQARAGEEITLAVRYIPFNRGEIKFHIYGNEPSPKFLYINTQIVLAEEPAIEWELVWPEPEIHESSIGMLPWYAEPTVVLARGVLPVDTPAGPLTLTGSTIFSACTEDMCLAPSQVELSWDLEVLAADDMTEFEVLSEAELLAPVEVDLDRFSLPSADDDETATADGSEAATDSSDFLSNLDVEKPEQLALWIILLMSLAGGLILNVMPCVLPVVSIKVIDLVRSMEKEAKSIWTHGMLFVAGIIATFLVGAIIIAIIQVTGEQLNWGFQFQNKWFVIAMATIIFLFGLSLADVFKIKPPAKVAEGGGKAAESEGAAGSFFKGVLATLLGTPCVGPFLGPALGYAFTREWYDTIVIFAAVGIGMALPYFFILPFVAKMGRRERGKLSRKMQESKAWMDHFKHFMAFLLFGTVVWLLNTIAGLAGGAGVIRVLWFLTTVAIAAWLWGLMVTKGKRGIAIGLISALVIMAGGGWLSFRGMDTAHAGVEASVHEGWIPFTTELLQEEIAGGNHVLVDFTADWCPNCKTNEAVALNIDSTMGLAEELGVTMMIADWTDKSQEIQDILGSLGRSAVPLTAIFPAGDPARPILLDGVFTPEQVQEKMREAAER